MNELVQTILLAFQSGDIVSAEQSCKQYISECKTAYMENLTLDTGTNYVGSVILFSQLCAQEKKPWRALEFLRDIEGCLRFLDDFMQDRQTLSDTYLSVSSAFEYAGDLPATFLYAQKSASLGERRDALEQCAVSLFYLSCRCGKEIPAEVKKHLERILGKESLLDLKSQGEEAAGVCLLFDPVELEDRYRAILFEVEREVDAKLSEETDSDAPFCLRYWRIKKSVLKEHRIDWKSPADCNPGVRFQ